MKYTQGRVLGIVSADIREVIGIKAVSFHKVDKERKNKQKNLSTDSIFWFFFLNFWLLHNWRKIITIIFTSNTSVPSFPLREYSFLRLKMSVVH